jgi:putative tryptophan/tyrosine transport system substrate-binding protein
MIRRREALTLLGGAAAAWPVGAWAQPITKPVIGFLGPSSSVGFAPYQTPFRQSLKEAGYVEDQNVAIEYRWAEDQVDRLPALAAELVSLRVDVIATVTATAAALAAKNATATIPIVFAIGADPVNVGLVASLNRPGGNVTGVSFLSNALVAKQMELLRELVPNAAVIGILINPNNPNAGADEKAAMAAARSLGRRVHVAHARNERDFDAAFAALVRAGATALVVVPDAAFTSRPNQLAAIAARHALPAIYSRGELPAAGGLMSYGSSLADAVRQVGVYVGRILNGAKPADLPVVQPTKFELVINAQTARALGLTVPATLLARADEVIE